MVGGDTVGGGMLNLLATAVGDLQDAVLITQGERGPDGQRRIIFINKAFAEMTGFTEAEVIGNTPDLTIGPETDREQLKKIQVARDALVPVRVELLKYRKDKSTFWAELDVVPVLNDQRRCTHFLGVMRDVTERRAAYTRLLEQDRFAAIGTLAAGVAHEINNPLAYLLLNLTLLEGELPALIASSREPSPRWAELLRALNEMRAGATRVARIVHDIQSFSNIDSPRSGPCEIPTLLDRAIQLACTGLPTRARVVCLYNGEGNDDGELPQVAGDAARLAQVFLNLLINAIDSIPQDQIDKRRVEVKAYRQGPSVVVEIRDDGVGIPPEVLPRIFDPFFTTKDVGRGMGLGLSISRTIVQGLGGMMIVESTVNVGTVVRVTLPIVRTVRDTGMRRKAVAQAEHVDVGNEAAPSEAGRGRRILIVDDELAVGRSLQRALMEADDELIVCERGQGALDLLEAGQDFHLILCDLSMPSMSGAELYDRIATRWPGLERRILIMTGGASSDATRAFLERGSIRRIDKPIDLGALRALLGRMRKRVNTASGVHEAPELSLLRLSNRS
jgi:PAS domain S-box-containing protein